jgi:hypothetical protein
MDHDYKYVLRHTNQLEELVAAAQITTSHPIDLAQYLCVSHGFVVPAMKMAAGKRSSYSWTGEIRFVPPTTLKTVAHEMAHHITTKTYGVPRDNGYRPHGKEFIQIYDRLLVDISELGLI